MALRDVKFRRPCDAVGKLSYFNGWQRFRVMTSKLGICLVLVAAGAVGQPAESRLTFEVASVRAAGSVTSKNADEVKRGAGMQIDGAQVDIWMMSLADLVRQAYGLKAFQFSGPQWMSSERYEIHAKLPSGATPAQVPAMLQTLLAGRFQLVFHRDSREHQVYALLVGKNGLKLQLAGGTAPDNPRDKRLDMPGGTMHLNRKMTMPALCDFLGGFVDRPVIDMTGLTDTYQVTLDIPVDELKRAKIAAEGVRPGDIASDPSGSSAMFTAVQQLGLKLEPRKTAVDVLIVDHAEKVPTEN
jgi:uncharacterized protein (TIGR03435 family)